MAADKTIEQLIAATSLSLTDDGVVVQGGVTKKTQLQLYLALLGASLSLGSVITFGTTIPTGGKDTDVYLKTDSNQFYQRISGTWTVFYTFPAAVSGTSFRYGTTPPLNTLGIDGDSYINTITGIFYLKTAGTYVQVFSMATGPQGPQGTPGTDGTNGADGNTILYGNGNPSNGMGVDGNFYLNTGSYLFFGPKVGGVWPSGVSLIVQPALQQTAFLNASTNQVQPFVLGDFITYILVKKVSGSPTLDIGTTSGGGEILPSSPITGFTPINAEQYFDADGDLYCNISGGAVNIYMYYLSNIV